MELNKGTIIIMVYIKIALTILCLGSSPFIIANILIFYTYGIFISIFNYLFFWFLILESKHERTKQHKPRKQILINILTHNTMKVIFRTLDTIQIFRFGTTANDKIEANKKRKIVQSYTFSRKQFEFIKDKKSGMKDFFNIADSNCLDCPYNEYGKCYTHKFDQYMGFRAMLTSTLRKYETFEDIPFFDDITHQQILKICKGTYVRFGTYGEPSLHPYELIQDIVKIADNWTGYTHQWRKKVDLSPFFMASTHTDAEDKDAKFVGFRSFIATDEIIKGAVNCPASKEANYKSTCSKCGLCSGTEGKGTKSIYIFNH